MSTASQREDSLRRAARRLAGVWLLLIALLLLSLGSAYLSLGIGNAIAGLLIAALKAALVVWFFMRLRAAPALLRITAIVALLVLILMFSLSGVDYATRILYRAPWQTPQQLGSPDLNPRRR